MKMNSSVKKSIVNTVLKHLKEDQQEFKKQIKDDQKLKKALIKSKKK